MAENGFPKRRATDPHPTPQSKGLAKPEWANMPQELWDTVIRDVREGRGTLNRALRYRLVSRSWDKMVLHLLKQRKCLVIELPVRQHVARPRTLSDILVRVAALCPALTHLQFNCRAANGKTGLTNDAMKTLSTEFPTLEHLNISAVSGDEYSEDGINHLANIKGIKTFTMKQYYTFKASCLINIATSWKDTLQRLVIRGCGPNFVTKEAATAIAKCTALTEVGLQLCDLEADPILILLESCRTLTYLDVSTNEHAFYGKKLIWPRNTSLQTLDVRNCGINYEHLLQIQACYPNLKQLYLKGRYNRFAVEQKRNFIESMKETHPDCLVDWENVSPRLSAHLHDIVYE